MAHGLRFFDIYHLFHLPQPVSLHGSDFVTPLFLKELVSNAALDLDVH
jgi:hypothetical protein